jgi:hypothetical protein
MQNEVNPRVLEVVERIRTSTPRRGITEVIERIGVRDARDKRSDYAWALTGGGFLLTVWSEFTYVHEANKRWFCVESLDTKRTRLGSGERGPLQQARAEFRVSCLRTMFTTKQDCSAVLQINRLSITQLEKNANAEVSVRVKDDERWHVAAWDEARNRAILVRGPRGWAPTTVEVDEYLTRLPMDSTFNTQMHRGAPANEAPAPPVSPPAPPEPRLAFADQAHRDEVEAAAVAHMTSVYRQQGLVVRDVSKENLGYDLRVDDAEGATVHLTEVKGTSMLAEGFFISRNERRCAGREPTWCLAVVTNALTAPSERTYSAAQMEDLFSFEPLVWRCAAKLPSNGVPE